MPFLPVFLYFGAPSHTPAADASIERPAQPGEATNAADGRPVRIGNGRPIGSHRPVPGATPLPGPAENQRPDAVD
jgi:hypothetical protein